MPEAKVALSYYISEWDEDAVLDDYGIRDWVENLPEKKIAGLLYTSPSPRDP